MVRKIVKSGNPILRKISKPVGKIDAKTKELIRDLKDTLAVQKDPEGVGLAAPQIGKNLRVFAMSYNNFERIVINPEIVKPERKTIKKSSDKTKKKKNEILEGCLSLPNYYGPLKRIPAVTIRYLNEKSETVTETFADFYAQIVMHEIDHLNGIIFLDRLLEQKKPLFKLDGKKWEEVELS